jgi:hypothetical protein
VAFRFIVDTISVSFPGVNDVAYRMQDELVGVAHSDAMRDQDNRYQLRT